MRLIAVGRAGPGAPEAKLFQRYAARIRPALGLLELADGFGGAAEIKRREGGAILAALAPAEFLIALDGGGMAPDSVALASYLERWSGQHKKLAFVIGGAEGLSAAVLARAGAVLSLGAFTWPHLLARVLLAEQLYRAQMIRAGHPYHRAGRPA